MTDTQGTNPTDDSAQSNGDATPASEHTPTAPDAPTVPPHTAPAASAHNGYPPAPPLPGAQQPQQDLVHFLLKGLLVAGLLVEREALRAHEPRTG